MTAQELRASLLREAVTGRLVPQRAEEGSAETLYGEIQQEKARLIAEKKIKKEKPLPPVTEEEQPFSIPSTWKWVRIGDIFHLQAGKNITSSHIFSSYSAEHPYICYGGNGIRGYVKNYNNEGNFAIIGRQGAYCGNIKFATGKFYATEHAVIVHTFSDTNVDWSGLFLEALNLNQYSTSTAQPGLSVSKIMHYLIPLPPLAEQKRIVDKLKELLPLVDAYGEAEQRLATYEDRFPDALKRSLLQEAVTGRLVPQRAEEGSAEALYEEIRQEKARLIAEKKLKKEKPLPPVTEEEQPFSIPATWKWTRLGECISARAGLAYKKSNLDIQSDEMIRVLRGGNILNMHYALKDDDIRIASTFVSKELLLKRNMIITPAVTSLENLGKAARIEKDYSDIVVGGFVLTLTPHLNKDIFAKFILYTFCSKYFRDILKQCTNKSGQAFYNISRAKMLLIPVPLPPLEEQKRIVAKLEELLALTERIREARR